MLKLMKYEFRKNRLSKLILLVLTAISEVLYLAGVFFEWENGLGFGVLGLTICAMVGIIYIGIESLITFYRDLNTKQSYMLFLTPRSSFQILGAKVLENALSIFLAGLLFALLAAVDISTALIHIGGLEELVNFVKSALRHINITISINGPQTLIGFMSILTSWLMMIVTGYLAILLSATVLAGKKLSGLISFAIFVLLDWLFGILLNYLPKLEGTMYFVELIGASLVITVVMYLITGWIMERKLSV